MPGGFSITTRWASSCTTRKPTTTACGRGAFMSTASVWPARTRTAGSRAGAPSSRTLPLSHRRRASLQLRPGRRRRSAAANVLASSAPSSVNPSRPRASAPISVGVGVGGLCVGAFGVANTLPTDELEHAVPAPDRAARGASRPLRHVGAATALAAQMLGHLTHDLAGVVATGEIRRHHRHQPATLSPSTPASTTTPERSLSRSWSRDVAQGLGVGDVGAPSPASRTPPMSAPLTEEVAPAASKPLALERRDLLSRSRASACSCRHAR